MKNRTIPILVTGAVLATIVAVAPTPSVSIAAYEFPFQEQYGSPAQFLVGGPGVDRSSSGDVMMNRVVFNSGEDSRVFYRPTDVRDVSYVGDHHQWRVRGGNDITVGEPGVNTLGRADGNNNDVTQADLDAFAAAMLEAFQNRNLNSYVDHNGGGTFEFTLSFGEPIIDNDSGPDEYGELLYFERGAGNGNSWLKIQAVDAAGNALGPWFVIDPSETLQTTPQAILYGNQAVGTVAIDLTRLGVTEVEHIRVSNDVVGEYAYTGGGDLQPDFKLLAVMTDPVEISRAMGTFD